MIKSLISKYNGIKIVVQLTDSCNFRCHYCLFGQNFSNNFISIEDIKSIIKLIKDLKNKYKNHHIEVVLTGGEPFLHKDINEIISKILKISDDKISIFVFTNGYFIGNNLDFKSFSNNTNINFLLSYHFFEYEKLNIEFFIKSIKKLIDFNINFSVKFLVPDKLNLPLFKKNLNKIIKETLLKKDNYFFDYLRDNFGNDLYDYSEIEYSKKIDYGEDENLILEATFEDGSIKNYGLDDFLDKKLNNFYKWRCYFTSSDFFSLNISCNGEITFGTCNTLNSEKFNFSNILGIVGDENIYKNCGEKTCSCGRDVMIKKEKDYLNKFESIERVMFQNIKKNDFFFLIDSINIEENYVNFSFKKDENTLRFTIEKLKEGKSYLYKFSNYGISYFIISNSNIILKQKDLSDDYIKNIYKISIFLSKFMKIYDEILI